MPSNIDRERQEQVDALLKRAQEKSDNLRQAEAVLQEALGLSPADPRVWFVRGELYSAHEMQDKALACYEQASAMAPDKGAYEEACIRTRAQLEHQATKESELSLPKVIVARGTDGLLPAEDLETKVPQEETVILDQEEQEQEQEQDEDEKSDEEELLVTKVLWKGAEALGKGAKSLGTGLLDSMDRDEMLDTFKETSGEIKNKLSRILANVDPTMMETVQETVKDTAAEVKSDVLQILKTLELGTKELEIVEEEDQEPGGAEADADAEAAPAEEAGLAVKTRALLEVIEQGDAAAVLDLCRGEEEKRPQIPAGELALVTVQALVSLAQQILDSVPHTEDTAGEALDELRKELGGD